MNNVANITNAKMISLDNERMTDPSLKRVVFDLVGIMFAANGCQIIEIGIIKRAKMFFGSSALRICVVLIKIQQQLLFS